MISLRSNKTKLYLAFMLLLIAVIFFGNEVIINIRFMIIPTKVVDGKVISIDRSRFQTTVTYSYQVESEFYNGEAIKDIIPFLQTGQSIRIRYLVNNEGISTVESFIMTNLILNCVACFFFLFLLLLLFIGLIGLLPIKNQVFFDIFLNKKIRGE